ncbi:DNA-directed RNA polymerase II subunit GRINL1A [Belonocnema kinseyi]|uniref:DNA-directed RNA polymerase II subunit GRINL1A n=1 Tax=Belonocnema kinseyi TaxID=2817044 RepID=UPI00143DCEB1|nr:DNA-directed RNA polymerase II subunit GRINL1A [Belonocnema kinseyi]
MVDKVKNRIPGDVPPPFKRIPGDIPPRPKKEKQGYLENLGKLRKIDLGELLERQNKLLANKIFISKLPDKGEKIKGFREKIVKEIERRNEVDEAARLLSRLNIAQDGKSAMNQLEWTGKYSEKDLGEKIVELDSDDDEDPLKILAQPTGSGVHKKKVIILPPEEKLIKPEDLQDIDSFDSSEPPEIEHVKYIVNLVENSEKETRREKYMPYKTTKSNVHDPMKEKVRKKDKHWEITAATPPLIVHGAVQVLSLNESLRLQKEQAEKLQQIQAKHATQRLMEQLGAHSLGTLPANVGSYRSTSEAKDSDSSDASDDEEIEVHDEEESDKGRSVVYTVH